MKTSIRARALLVLVVTLASFSGACNYNRVNGSADGSVQAAKLDVSRVDFRALKAAVVGPKCLSCHSSEAGNQGGVNLESFKALRAMLGRASFRALEKRDMPPKGPLAEDEMRIFRAWIEAGAPERIVGPVEKIDPQLDAGPNDWAKVRGRVFAKKCLDCHSGTSPQGDLDLSSIVEVREKAAKIFDRIFVKGDMPIAPYPAMIPRERRVLLQWFDNGMPE